MKFYTGIQEGDFSHHSETCLLHPNMNQARRLAERPSCASVVLLEQHRLSWAALRVQGFRVLCRNGSELRWSAARPSCAAPAARVLILRGWSAGRQCETVQLLWQLILPADDSESAQPPTRQECWSCALAANMAAELLVSPSRALDAAFPLIRLYCFSLAAVGRAGASKRGPHCRPCVLLPCEGDGRWRGGRHC